MIITPEKVKNKMLDLGLTYQEVYETLGYSRSWFCKTLMENARHSFHNPNPERMKRIWKYLDEYEKVKQNMDKLLQLFLRKWQ